MQKMEERKSQRMENQCKKNEVSPGNKIKY